MKSRHSGFTLIELLVVVSIIALLIGILLPALGGARNEARKVQCLTNVRGLGQMASVYNADYKGQYPPRAAGSVGGGGVWGAFTSSRALALHTFRDIKTFACPSDEDKVRIYPIGGAASFVDHVPTSTTQQFLGIGHVYGTGDTDTKGVRISYAINANLTIAPTATNRSVMSNKVEDYRHPGATFNYIESPWINSRGYQNTTTDNLGASPSWWIRYRFVYPNFPGRLVWSGGGWVPDSDYAITIDGVSTNITGASPAAPVPAVPDSTGFNGQYLRHTGVNNTGFLDGSARSVPLAELIDYTPSPDGIVPPQAKILHSKAEDVK